MRRLVDWTLERRGTIERDGERLFTMRNYGGSTPMRLRSFFTKEPETLRWIDGFAPGSLLFDIGANVGSYTLYAAYRGHRVMAFEPEALNFALLNLNIHDNGMNDRVLAYPFAIHDSATIAELNLSEFRWGGAHNSFERALDWTGAPLPTVYRQGSAGISIDDFVARTGAEPNYIKIDVDGNEIFVLKGAARTLRTPTLRGVLVELTDGHPERTPCIELLQQAGLELVEQVSAAKRSRRSADPDSVNHIFARPAA